MPLYARALLATTLLAAPLHPLAAPAAPAAPVHSLAEPSLSPDHREIVFVSGGDIWTVAHAGGEARLLVSHPATESRPMWSPDGTRIAFVSNRSGNGDLYVLTLASGDLRRVTFDEVPDQLDNWSRDGRSLYFSSSSRDIAGMSDVWRVSAEGGTPVQVAADRYAAEYWAAPAPDGRSIAITARGVPFGQWWRHGHSHIDESEIWLVHDVAHGAAATPRYEAVTQRGAKSAWPMWSADGRTLYFMSDRNGHENLWARSAGGEARLVTSFTAGRVLWPAISHDGHAIVFERDFGVWSHDVASGQTRQVPITLRGVPAGPGVEHQVLTTGIQQLALSPDARKVAFVVRGEVFAASAKEGGDAARVTSTPGSEEQLAWAPDSRRLAYSSDRNGSWHLFLYDFLTRTETQLTRGSDTDIIPRWSPDGQRIAYVRNGRELRVLTIASGIEVTVATGTLSRPPFVDEREFAWSPDGRWLAYVASAGTKQFANVFVVRADRGTMPRQVSWLSNAGGGGLSWSPDGTYLTLTSGQRTEAGEVTRIDLVPRTPRFREEQFRDLFAPPTLPRQTQQPSPGTPAPVPPVTTTADTAARRDSAVAAAASARNLTRIDFEDIRRRVSVLPLGVDANSASISPDGKTLLATATSAGQTNLYTYSLDELNPTPVARQLTSTPGFKSAAHWSSDGKEVWYLEAGRINSVTVETRAVRPVAVSAELDVDFAREKMAVFAQAWSFLRDNFFDARMNGTDWAGFRTTYGARVGDARTPDEMRRIMNLMIGELNASHLGIGGPPAQQPYAGRLGLRFERAEYEREGRLRISEVLPLSPAALGGQVAVGDVLVAIDGRTIDARTNVDELLAYRVGKETTVTIAPAAGVRRTVTLLPVSAGTEKGLRYRDWVESRRAYVEKASGGRLGYVHMQDMGEGSLRQLYVDLDAGQHAREGVVVDVRNNNGGFVNPYALDVLARRPYLTMQTRDQAATSARSQLGQRSLELPTILVTNQHSLSDAEDFTEGYRTMRLGKVVGEPTSGWIIFTSNRTLLDGTTVRIPSTRITGADGKDMEMNPRPVDVPVTRPVGESYTSRDSQLDVAVRELLAALKK